MSMRGRLLTFLAVLVALLSHGPSALAQDSSSAADPAEQVDGPVEPTEEQKALNDKGVKALIAKDYERAVALLNESLALGEFNITYLNLGRAYQKLGQCEEARNAYLSAVSAPAVEEPAQRIVDAKADQYLTELEEECAEEFATTDETAVESPGGVPSAVSWGLIGGGGAVAAFGAFGIIRAATLAPDDLQRDNDGFVTEPTQRQAFEDRDASRRWSAIGLSALSVGVVAAGIGTYLLMTGDTMESQPTATVGPDGSWRVGWSVRF
jgi:tetratricopeptide (TPR) repeat protein